MAADASWDEAGLRQRCTDLRATLAQAGLATPDELDAYWPGGRENREESPGDWIYCYASFVRIAGREETPAERVRREDAEAAVLAALRDDPEPVELIAPGPDGGPAFRSVYPKSFDTLCHVSARDRELLRLAAAAQVLTESSLPELVERGRAVYEEISYQTRVLVWIVTHPGPGLPWADDVVRPEPPDWTLVLDPADIIRLVRAHQRVNGTRIGLISDLMAKGQGRGKGPGWATLGAMGASDLGVSSRVLLRDWSLAGWLAQLLLTAEAKAEAHARATGAGGPHGG